MYSVHVSARSFSIINVLVWINDDANVTDGRHAYIYIYSMMSVFVCVTRTILSYSNLFSFYISHHHSILFVPCLNHTCIPSLVTSVGVERTNEMPFLILNLFGVLDAKRSGEEAVKTYAQSSGYSYSIIRPGRLVGGPYTNLDLATLFQVEGGGASNGVTLQTGDALLGDCKRDVTAEAVLQCLENGMCEDVEFSMVSNEERALTEGEWGAAFLEMRGGGGGREQ